MYVMCAEGEEAVMKGDGDVGWYAIRAVPGVAVVIGAVEA